MLHALPLGISYEKVSMTSGVINVKQGYHEPCMTATIDNHTFYSYHTAGTRNNHMASCLDTDEGLICSSAEYLNILRTIVCHMGP
jgi:hypothetical protein